jgi:hypothetical protein
VAGSAGGTPGSPPRRTATVSAGNGTTWWSEGWRLFARSPGVWIGITVLLVVISVMLAFIPVLGTFATTLLAPVFAGGIMAGCRALDQGGELTIGHLFASFSDRLAPLVTVGLLYLAGTFVILVVIAACLFAVVGVTGIGALMTGDPLQAGRRALAAGRTAAPDPAGDGLLVRACTCRAARRRAAGGDESELRRVPRQLSADAAL